MKFKLFSLQTEKLFDELIQDEKLKEFLELLKDFHEETYEHALRVGLLSLDIGIENELSQHDLWSLGYAGLLHDIGKTEIPQEILTIPSSLVPQEYKTIQGHVRLGFLLLKSLEESMIQEIVVAHHEFTTAPYPRNGIDRREKNRASEKRRMIKPGIRKLSQIVAIVDLADALAHNRSYKEEFSKKETEEILRREFTGNHKFIEQILRRFREDSMGK